MRHLIAFSMGDSEHDEIAVVIAAAAACIATVFFDKSPPETARNEWRVNRHVRWTRTLSDPEFLKCYRLSPPSFEGLLRKVGGALYRARVHRPEHQLMMFLEMCAHGLPWSHVATRYGVGEATVGRYFDSVLDSVVALGLPWPSKAQQRHSAEVFSLKRPQICPGPWGAIDGTHIAVLPPDEVRQYYINRKTWTSMNVMAVCDAEMRFVFLGLGAPGSCHDARVYRRSQLPGMLSDAAITCPQLFLLGDAAYGNSEHLVCPCPTTPTRAHHLFNFYHSSLRTIIERVFSTYTHTRAHTHTHTQPTHTHTHARTHTYTQCHTHTHIYKHTGIRDIQEYVEDPQTRGTTTRQDRDSSPRASYST